MLKKDNLLKIVGTVLGLLISAVFGGLVQKHLQNEDNQTRMLDFQSEIRSDFIGRPDGSNKKLEVFLEGQKINDLTQVDIKIYNPTDKSYSDVPLFIELYSSTGDSLRLVESKISGKEGYSDFIQIIPNMAPAQHKGSLKFTYNLKTVHQLGEKPVFIGSFLIIGKSDNIHIDVIKQGLDLGGYNIKHYNKPMLWQTDTFLWSIFILLYIGVLFLIRRWVNWRSRGNTKKYQEFLKANLKTRLPEENVIYDNETIVNQIIFLSRKYNWLETSKFWRFVDGKKEPIEENNKAVN